MLTTPQQREVDTWLIKNQPQIQHLLKNNELKTLLYEVYEAGMQAQLNKQPEELETLRDDGPLTSYSSILTQNL